MMPAVAGGALSLGGFFPLRPSMLDWGYGVFRMNLLSLVNPDGGMGPEPWTWSSVLPTLPHAGGDYEGFAYGGLGVLLAIALAAPLLWTERRAYWGRRVWPLALTAVLLTLFAISPNVAIGDRGLAVPVPDVLMRLAGAMRSSGRFFWPVYYLLPLGGVWLLRGSLGDRATRPLLLALAALQVYDTYPGWSSLRPHFEVAGQSYPTSINDPRLSAVAAHYGAVRMLPARNIAPKWEQIAYFALRNGRPTDATYLARPDYDTYAAYMSGIRTTIAAHALAANSLYFLNRYYAWQVAQHMTADDAMFKVGDFYVFAPGWTRFGATTTLKPAQPWSPW
jgi:hypothetical protein